MARCRFGSKKAEADGDIGSRRGGSGSMSWTARLRWTRLRLKESSTDIEVGNGEDEAEHGVTGSVLDEGGSGRRSLVATRMQRRGPANVAKSGGNADIEAGFGRCGFSCGLAGGGHGRLWPTEHGGSGEAEARCSRQRCRRGGGRWREDEGAGDGCSFYRAWRLGF